MKKSFAGLDTGLEKSIFIPEAREARTFPQLVGKKEMSRGKIVMIETNDKKLYSNSGDIIRDTLPHLRLGGNHNDLERTLESNTRDIEANKEVTAKLQSFIDDKTLSYRQRNILARFKVETETVIHDKEICNLELAKKIEILRKAAMVNGITSGELHCKMNTRGHNMNPGTLSQHLGCLPFVYVHGQRHYYWE